MATVASGGRDHIGPYRLLKMIQVGNATHIWEAINSTDQRRVALKIPRAEHAESRIEAAGLKHEYDVGVSLNHPHLIRFYELGYFRKVPYLVMEYFAAPNLKQFQRQTPDRLLELMPRVVWQMLDALCHFHDKQWVHRDIKPENVLMDESGLVKVIDFAIAQRVRKGLGRIFAGKTPVQGTRSYISPEQIRREPVD
ncbi:MAG TPA: serine/threonine-protein kinase, partial [Pirellulaceae bacterium]